VAEIYECSQLTLKFVPGRPFQPSKLFTSGMKPAQVNHHTSVPFLGRLQALPNVILDLNGNVIKLFCPYFTIICNKAIVFHPGKLLLLSLTNTLVWCKNMQITNKKVCNIRPKGQCYKIFYSLNLLIFVISQSTCPR
jgi:hypothetical protein